MPYQPASDEERAFLAAYRHKNYPRPALTADVAALRCHEGQAQILLIERGGFPYKGRWALPGGFVDVGDAFDDQGEELHDAAARELEEECHIPAGTLRLHPAGLFGSPGRDPRTRVITVVYLALLDERQAAGVRAGDDAADTRWQAIATIDELELAFDHDRVIAEVMAKARDRAERSSLLAPWLPSSFDLAQLESVHRALWGQAFDQGRFTKTWRRQIEDGVLLEQRGQGEVRLSFVDAGAANIPL